jgi:hypothetical protein
LNLAWDLASRFMLSRLDTGVERPEDRSVNAFRHPDLAQWVLEHRQQLVAAVHTIVRAYLQECRRCGGTPVEVAARRHVDGTRFGGPCELLRDCFLWAFPDLPDPFLAFQASALNSSTKDEAALVLGVLDRVMTKTAGQRSAPVWVTSSAAVTSPQRTKWGQKFRARWNALAPALRERCYGTPAYHEAEADRWERIRRQVQTRAGRRELRAGRCCCTTSEIIAQLGTADVALVQGATHATHSKELNPVSLGRWLKERLVDAPIDGRVLRSAKDRKNLASFWIEGV